MSKNIFLPFALSLSLVGLLCSSQSAKAEETLQNIWNDFDVSNPNLPLPKEQAVTPEIEKPALVKIPKAQLKPVAAKAIVSQPQEEKSSSLKEAKNEQSINLDFKSTGIGKQVQLPSQDPYELLHEVQESQNKPAPSLYLDGGNDPAGKNLERQLPLGEPLSERFANDILDPIELDVDSNAILDLSIQRALVLGLQQNLPQRIIDETVIRDKWRFWGTFSGLLPDVFGSYNLLSSGRPPAASSQQAIGNNFLSGISHRSQLGVSYNLAPSEIFSTLASYYDWMANSSFQSSSLQDLMRQITNQYYDVMRARGELAVRIEAVKQAKIQLGLNEKLEQAGVGTKFAVLQAREQMAENELALLSQQSSARIAEIQLLTTLNMPLGTDIRLEENEIFRRTLVSPDYPMGELVDLAMTHRPDIRRRQFAFKAARKRVVRSVADAFTPTFGVQASTARIERGFTRSLDVDFDRDTNFKSVSFQVNMPILTGLGLGQISPINEQRALSRQAGLELENEMLQIEAQVRDAFLRSQSADKQIEAADRQLSASTEGIKLARIRLQNGVGTNIDLIDTQRNYVNSLVNKVRAIVEYNQAQVDLLRSIGLISTSDILNQTMAYRDDIEALDDEDEKDNGFQSAGYSSKGV